MTDVVLAPAPDVSSIIMCYDIPADETSGPEKTAAPCCPVRTKQG